MTDDELVHELARRIESVGIAEPEAIKQLTRMLYIMLGQAMSPPCAGVDGEVTSYGVRNVFTFTEHHQ